MTAAIIPIAILAILYAVASIKCAGREIDFMQLKLKKEAKR